MLLKLENSSKKIHNALQEDLQMVEATSCGGVVIYPESTKYSSRCGLL